MKLADKTRIAGIKDRTWVTFIMFIFLCNNLGYGSSPLVYPPKSTEIQKWVKRNFAKGKVPPFSFTYGGKSSDTFITDWEYGARKLKNSETDKENFIYTYSDRTSGLAVRCEVTVFDGFQAVEWVLKFENTSNENTPIIENVAAINHSFISDKEGTFVLHHAKGSNAGKDDFMPQTRFLEVNSPMYMTPQGGRSSDKTAFPFFNIEKPDNTGVMVAVGWTGKWYADVQQKNKTRVELRAGMENLSLYLLPKEEIRSPKICLLFWEGKDRMIGHNQFRKLILAHYTRKIDGTVPNLPLAAFLDREGPQPCNEHVCSTENHAISEIKRHQQFDILPEVFWLDAGWYPCEGFWPNVGNWIPNPNNFPNGLKPVSDAVHGAGAKFLLWFEPERIVKNKPYITIDKEHPDWVTGIPSSDSQLLNLGNENARTWLMEHISQLIQKEGIDYYRQDFNFDPFPYWKQMDAQGRNGISEIRHIEGLYAYWDALLERFPNLIIDNCASGGRRIDLETVTRSSPFWRTDYKYGEPIGSQIHTYGLNFYLPISGTGSFEMSTYHFRSAMSSHMVTDWDIENKKFKIEDMQKLIKEFKELRPYYYNSDYYPLTSTEKLLKDDAWMAYQLNRPEKDDGMIMAFRRPNSDDQEIDLYFTGLNERTTYEVKDKDTGEIIIKTGKELSEGMRITLEKAPGSICLVYNKK